MKVISYILAVIMLMFGPVMNFIDNSKPKQEGTFMEYEAPQKTERGFLAAAPGANDIVLSAGDSLPAAIDRVRAMRAGGNTVPVTVWLREGVYATGGTLSLDGISDLTLAAWENENVTLTEGIQISGFRNTTVNGVAAWAADVPEGVSFASLYKGETPLSRTRYPESGYLTVKAPDRSASMFTEENTPWEYTYGDRSFYYDKDLTRTSFYHLTDVRIKLMHYWFCESTSLTGIENGKVGVQKPCSMRIREGDRYFFENVFEMLKKPGQWYLDRAERTVYYIPQPGEDIGPAVLFAPQADVLLELNNAENIAFHNIRFVGTDCTDPVPDAAVSWLGSYGMLHPQGNLEVKGAVEVKDSSFVSFTNCDFVNLGNTGVRFTGRNTDCDIAGCRFKNIGCNGVFISGKNSSSEAEQTRRINVTDCLIESYGRNIPSGIGVLLTYAADCDLRHNEVHDGYYTAFSIGWVWGYAFHATDDIRVCDNLIYDIGQGWLSDMGGIYTLGAQPHTVLSGNVIHNVAADPGEGGYGGWGIYLDEGSGNITVKNNLVYDCGSQSFHQHYGIDNVITNNIFAFSGEGQIRSTRTEDHNEFDLTGNIIVGQDQPLWVNASEDRFTESGNLVWDYTNFSRVYGMMNTEIRKIDRVYPPAMRLKGWLKTDQIADPLFRDAANRDFTLAENSPAITLLGFTPWNYLAAGTLSRF